MIIEGLEKYLIRMAKDRGAPILPDHKTADISFTSTTGRNGLGGTGRQAACSDDKTWHIVDVVCAAIWIWINNDALGVESVLVTIGHLT